MKETPMLMSGSMVRATLRGDKTQTRRIIKRNASGRVQFSKRQRHIEDPSAVLACPFGKSKDHLWLRETWCVARHLDPYKPRCLSQFNDHDSKLAVDYRADTQRIWSPEDQGEWRPSIHMPRWASRITLEISGVRVERLQDISEADCKAEGINCADPFKVPYNGGWMGLPVERFQYLWESINGIGSWALNPFVWVIEFHRIKL